MPEPGKVGATTKPTKTDDENNTQEKNSSEKKRQPHYTSMTHKYYLTLRALFKKVENPGPVKGEKNEICERINKLLNETQMNWSNAQEAELLLAEVIDEPTLRVEVCRRLSEVDSLEDGAVKSFYNNHSCKDLRKEVPTEGEEKKTKHLFPEEYLRSLYARLLNDLQWQSNKDLWKKKLANDARTKSGLLFIGVLLTFLSIVLFCFAQVENIPSLTPPAVNTTNSFLSVINQTIPWIIVAFAGALGASFSIFSSAKLNLAKEVKKSVEIRARWRMLFSRVVYGAGAGIIFLLLIKAQYIGGQLFDLLEISDEIGKMECGVTNIAKISVIGILAGFSEHLVARLLSEAATKANIKTN